MSNGRTMWFALDVARHRRSLMVDLQDEFGPAALALDVVLTAHAKEQNQGGEVRDGFSALAREAGMSGQGEVVRAFVERAAEIGWLDDLVVDEDGRRFEARVSGWKNDQDRARASWKKAGQRDAKKDPCLPDSGDGDKGGQGGDMSPVVPKCPPTAQHSTAQIRGREGAREPDLNAAANNDKLRSVVEVLRSCPRLTFDLELLGVAHALAAHPDADALRAAHIAVSNASDPNYRTTDAGKALRYALNELEVGEAKRSRHLAPVADRDRERAVREEEKASIARLMNNTRGDVA